MTYEESHIKRSMFSSFKLLIIIFSSSFSWGISLRLIFSTNSSFFSTSTAEDYSGNTFAEVNDSEFGLQAGLFTNDAKSIFKA